MSDNLPSLGVPVTRLLAIIEDLGGVAKAGALSCGEYYAKCIRPVCKANGLPLVQQIALKDESTRSSKPRCGAADTLVIVGGGHGVLDACAALTLHLLREQALTPEESRAERLCDDQVSTTAAYSLLHFVKR